jgi:uncharacterized membrane protein YGL010W
MRAIDRWFDEYSLSHTHATNVALHELCVPLIVLAVLGLVQALAVPQPIVTAWPGFRWSYAVIALSLIYYARLSLPLALGMAPVLIAMALLLEALRRAGMPVAALSLALFVVAWIGQFIGHGVEGRRPSFFKDLQFLLIGPLWVLGGLYRRLGLNY